LEDKIINQFQARESIAYRKRNPVVKARAYVTPEYRVDQARLD